MTTTDTEGDLDGFIMGHGWFIDEPRPGITRATHKDGEMHEGDGNRWRTLAEHPEAIIGSIPEYVVFAANRVANPHSAYDIPVIFTVWGAAAAGGEADAARRLRDLLASVNEQMGTGTRREDERPISVDSWYMPNHPEIDGNDGDVYVEVKQR